MRQGDIKEVTRHSQSAPVADAQEGGGGRARMSNVQLQRYDSADVRFRCLNDAHFQFSQMETNIAVAQDSVVRGVRELQSAEKFQSKKGGFFSVAPRKHDHRSGVVCCAHALTV